MPLTAKGEEIKSALEKEYGAEKGERVLYAGKNKGTFTGIDAETKGEARQRVSEYKSAIKIRINNGESFRTAKTIEEARAKAKELNSQGMKAEVVGDADSATMTRIADAINNLQQRFDAMCSRDADEKKPASEPKTPDYNKEAVNKAIAASNKSGQKIGGKEASKIHALLKGRY